jgi:hypothetical protein
VIIDNYKDILVEHVGVSLKLHIKTWVVMIEEGGFQMQISRGFPRVFNPTKAKLHHVTIYLRLQLWFIALQFFHFDYT